MGGGFEICLQVFLGCWWLAHAAEVQHCPFPKLIPKDSRLMDRYLCDCNRDLGEQREENEKGRRRSNKQSFEDSACGFSRGSTWEAVAIVSNPNDSSTYHCFRPWKQNRFRWQSMVEICMTKAQWFLSPKDRLKSFFCSSFERDSSMGRLGLDQR